MGWAVRDKATGWIGGWIRYDKPEHDPNTQELVECETREELLSPQQIAAESQSLPWARPSVEQRIEDLAAKVRNLEVQLGEKIAATAKTPASAKA